MARVEPDAIVETRRLYAARGTAIDDLPDEAVERLLVTAGVNLNLRMRDLSRAVVAHLPGPLRRFFER